jgi:hypothetical protein
MGKWIGTLVVALAAMMITGCTTPVEGSPERRDQPRSSSADTVTSPPAEVDSETSTPPAESPDDAGDDGSDSGAIPVGEGVYAYEDGLTVEVTALAPYTPGDFAIGADTADSAITFSVTITNGTSEPVDLAITTVNVNAGAAGNVAEEIYDGDMGGGFTGAVLPGKAATAAYAFAVDASDLGEIVIEVEPGFLSYDAAYFEGSLA